MPDDADLEHHHADGVGDDVVQLARDPRPLLGDGDAGGGLPLPLGLRRANLGRLCLLLARLERVSRQPADPEQKRDEDELAGRVARLVVDDSGGAADCDPEADPRVQGVAEVAEQERRDHPGDERARRERDEIAVDERQRQAEQPEGGRRAERESAP